MPPLPKVEGANKPFWDGLRHREICVQRCGHCGLPRFPAARYCPRCRSSAFDWHAVDPKGKIETWCVFHQRYFEGLEVPYITIQVRLDCGIRFFSNPVGVDASALAIDMPVEAVFEDVTPEVTLLKFRPAEGSAR
jgi:uncharacterized OB-fold protein